MKIEEIMVESWESFDSSADEKLNAIVVKYFELLKSKPNNGLDLMYKCIYEFNQLADSEFGIEAGLGDSEPQNHMRTVVERLFKDYITDNKEVYDAFEDSYSKRLFNLKRSAHLLMRQTEKAKSYDKSALKNSFNNSLLLLDSAFPKFLSSIYDLVMVEDFSKLKSDINNVQRLFRVNRETFSQEHTDFITKQLNSSEQNLFFFYCLNRGFVDWNEFYRKNKILIDTIQKEKDKNNFGELFLLNMNIKRSEKYKSRIFNMIKYLNREISRLESLKNKGK